MLSKAKAALSGGPWPGLSVRSLASPTTPFSSRTFCSSPICAWLAVASSTLGLGARLPFLAEGGAGRGKLLFDESQPCQPFSLHGQLQLQIAQLTRSDIPGPGLARPHSFCGTRQPPMRRWRWRSPWHHRRFASRSAWRPLPPPPPMTGLRPTSPGAIAVGAAESLNTYCYVRIGRGENMATLRSSFDARSAGALLSPMSSTATATLTLLGSPGYLVTTCASLALLRLHAKRGISLKSRVKFPDRCTRNSLQAFGGPSPVQITQQIVIIHIYLSRQVHEWPASAEIFPDFSLSTRELRANAGSCLIRVDFPQQGSGVGPPKGGRRSNAYRHVFPGPKRPTG